MCYVYLLRDKNHPKSTYIGLTTNLGKRIKQHNSGMTKTTLTSKSWYFEIVVIFRKRHGAIAFEKYLKKGSGHAFAKRHFW